MAKIAISLPDAVLSGIEKTRKMTGETRSQFFRRAVEVLLQHDRERHLQEQYQRAYRRRPETSEEIGFAEDAARLALAESPWDESAADAAR